MSRTKQRVTIDLRADTWRRLKVAAIGERGGMRAIVERAVSAYLKRKGGTR